MRAYSPIFDTKRPLTVVVFYDSNNVPKLAISNFNGDENSVDMFYVNGVVLPNSGMIESIKISEARPSQGSGLPVKSADITIASSEVFNSGVITRFLYSAGQNTLDVYCRIFLYDGAQVTKELTEYAVCLGLFKPDYDIGWTEGSAATTMRLTSVLNSMDEKILDINETTITNLRNSDWAALVDMPMYIGAFNRVRATSRVRISQSDVLTNPVTSDAIKFLKTGRIPVGFDSGTVDWLVLAPATDAFLTSNLGATIKVTVASGETIKGVLAVVPPTGIPAVLTPYIGYYAINMAAGTTVRDAGMLDTNIDVYSANEACPSTITATADPYALRMAKTAYAKVSSKTGFICSVGNIWTRRKSDDASVQRRCYAQLTGTATITGSDVILAASASKGIYNTSSGDTSSDTFKHTLFALSGYSMSLQRSSFTGELAHLNYAVVDCTTTVVNRTACNLHMRPPSAVPDAQIASGSAFFIYVTDSINAALTFDANFDKVFYFRAYSTTVLGDRVYASVNGKFKKLPTDTYTVAYNQSQDGLTNLVKITLTKSLSSIFLPETDGEEKPVVAQDYLVVDTQIPRQFTHVVKHLLCDITTKYAPLVSSAITGLSAPTTLDLGLFAGPALNIKISTEDTLRGVLDRLCYEAGMILTTNKAGMIDVASMVATNVETVEWKVGSQYYMAAAVTNQLSIISSDEIVVGSAGVNVGRVLGYKNSANNEFVAVRPSVTFTAAEMASEAVSIRPTGEAGKYDRILAESLIYINQSTPANTAVLRMCSAGHSSRMCESNRDYSITALLSCARFEVYDVVQLMDMPGLSDATTISYSNADGRLLWTNDAARGYGLKYSPADPPLMIPTLMVIDTVTIDLSDAYSVSINLRQTGTKTKVLAEFILSDATLATQNALPNDTSFGGSGTSASTPYIDSTPLDNCVSIRTTETSIPQPTPNLSAYDPCNTQSACSNTEGDQFGRDNWAKHCFNTGATSCPVGMALSLGSPSCSSCTSEGSNCAIDEAKYLSSGNATNTLSVIQGMGNFGPTCCSQVIGGVSISVQPSSVVATGIGVCSADIGFVCGGSMGNSGGTAIICAPPGFITSVPGNSPDGFSVSIDVTLTYTDCPICLAQDESLWGAGAASLSRHESTQTACLGIAPIPSLSIS